MDSSQSLTQNMLPKPRNYICYYSIIHLFEAIQLHTAALLLLVLLLLLLLLLLLGILLQTIMTLLIELYAFITVSPNWLANTC